MAPAKIMLSRNRDIRLTLYIFSQLEYVILIWNDTTNVQIYSFWTGASSRQGCHFGVKILTKNDEKMIDLESIQIHSSIVQGPSGHQKISKTINLDPQMLRKKIKKITPKLINLKGFGT